MGSRVYYLLLLTAAIFMLFGDIHAQDCEDLMDPADGQVNMNGNSSGSTATYSCDTGYTLTGVMNRTCGDDGNWTLDEPTCDPVDCNTLPNPPNGRVTNPAQTTFMNNATYSCNSGYMINGVMTRTCGSNGQWTLAEPTCDAIDCGTLSNITNGQVDTTSGTTFMNNATYSCDTGYMINGTVTRMCGDDAMWTLTEPTCDPVNCGPLSVTNGQVMTPDGTTFMNTATYSCDTGYMINGTVTRMCGDDAMWTLTEPTCDPVNCGPLSVTNGQVMTPDGTTFMNTATYSCDTGYMINGTVTRMCGDDAMWTLTEPTCDPVNCGPLSVTNGQVMTPDGTTFMNTATYSCDSGYRLDGSMSRTCGSDSQWNSTEPTCIAIDCGTLNNITNGQVDTSSGTTFMNNATHSCNTGYVINGVMTRTCGADGNWTLTEPTCDVAAPMITSEVMDTPFLIPGENAMFSLTANGLDLTYSWSDNNGDLTDTPGRIAGSNTSTLTVYNVSDSDDNTTYSCTVSNGAGFDTSEGSIVILSSPVIESPPMNVFVGAGDTANLTCEVSSNDGFVNATWTTNATDSDIVSPQLDNGVSTLVFMNVGANNRGVYTCTAMNRRDMVTASATLYVIVVLDIPTQTVPTGNDLNITCVAEGTPPNVTYSWAETRNGMFLGERFLPYPSGPAERVSGEDTSILTIDNVELRDDRSNYTCRVTVGAFSVSTTAMLDILVPVIIGEPLPDNVTLNINDTLELTCVGQNPPGAVQDLFFQWAVDSEPFSNDMINNTVVNSSVLMSTLLIESVTADDSGNYSCLVQNRMPVILGTGMGSSSDVQVLFTPRVSFDNLPYREQVGATINIQCNVRALPPASFAEIVQVVDGIEIQRKNMTQDLIGERMVDLILLYSVNNVQLVQNGTVFRCRANNSNGVAITETTIIVFDVPGLINHTAVTSIPLSLLSVNVTFPAPIDNNSPITAYQYTLCLLTCQISPSPVTVNADGNDLQTVQLNELTPNSEYILRIVGINEAGPTLLPSVADAYNFSSPTSADGAPDMLEVSIATQNALIFSWQLPLLARQPDVTPGNFTVTWQRQGGGLMTDNVDYNSMSLSQGFSLNNLTAGIYYNISVTANYFYPNFVSEPTMEVGRTLELGVDLTPLVEGMPTPGTNNALMLSFSWEAPANTDFLQRYIVSYTTNPLPFKRRRKRQGDMPIEFDVMPDATSATISDPEPNTAYSINLDGGFMPPGATSEVRVPVTPPTTIMSAQQPPSAPRDVTVEPSSNGDPYQTLDISWTAPAELNGMVRQCDVSLGNGNSLPAFSSSGVPTSHRFSGLVPGTLYTASVTCGVGDLQGPPGTGQGSTDLGVQQPGFSFISTTLDRRQLTFRLSFGDRFGPHTSYQIIVSTTNIDNTLAVTNLLPYPGVDGTYVARYANTNGQQSLTASVGTVETTTMGTTTYVNQPLAEGGTYFVFIRLFNSRGDFNDTASIAGPYFVPVPLNVAAVIAPIAIIAIILLIVLIVLVVFAVWRVQGPTRHRGYTVARNKDGKDIRLAPVGSNRRTRLFSPMLNVGSPDVFTSAGQPTTLICEASGTPAPEVTWTKDGEPLDKERFIQLADASLFVNDTDLQDEGAYVVKAVNSAGDAEQLVKVTVLRPVPPEPDEDHPIVRAGDFTEKIALLRANDDEALEDEYADIELDWTFTSYAAKLNINKNKNRYVNIIPYDHSRVVLSLQDNTPGSDYINGSFVDGYNKPNSYIATQGPIPSTFPDFWRMIWEMDSPTIVMVTNLKEEDKVKCHQYWPSYGTTTYGNIQVTLKEVENLAEYSIRTFTVTPLAGQSRAQMPVREVRQFHFLVWPDHGVPQYATALLTFRKRVCRYHPEKRGPLVVHCSAGVGRTGTYITIDVSLNQIESEGSLDIFNYVRHMRFRRNYMVQTSSQYVFIHDAILESIMCGDNSIPAPELKTKLQVLSEINIESGKSNFGTQFETLKTASPADDEFDCSVAQLPDNTTKNRFKEHLPSNEFRVVLSSEDDQSDYICASFVDGYRHRNNFIVTQAPLTETVGDFWRMVWEQKSAAIIMLTELEEGGQEMCVKYWPSTTGEAGVFGGYQLELSEDEKDKGDYTTRRFKLSPVDKPQESRMVTQFHFTRWPKATPPDKAHSILDLVDELQRVQRKSGNGPITVHCDNGIGRTGAFCTLYTVLERVKAEQVVDVFQAVKTLRIQRVGLMETLDEYEFIHKAVLEFLDSFSDYQNFK